MLVVHRDLPGTHDETDFCWCKPVIVADDDFRTTEEIVEASKVAEA